MFSKLLRAFGEGNADVRRNDDIWRAWIAVRRQPRPVDPLADPRSGENLADSSDVARRGRLTFQHSYGIRGLCRIRQPEQRDVVFGGPDSVGVCRRLGEGKQVLQDRCRRCRYRVIRHGRYTQVSSGVDFSPTLTTWKFM